MELFKILAVTGIALSAGVFGWCLMAVPLRRALVFLCEDGRDGVAEVGSVFWQRLYLGLILLLPLLCVLLFLPKGWAAYTWAETVLYALRWSVFGCVVMLLGTAYSLYRQLYRLRLVQAEWQDADDALAGYLKK